MIFGFSTSCTVFGLWEADFTFRFFVFESFKPMMDVYVAERTPKIEKWNTTTIVVFLIVCDTKKSKKENGTGC